MLDCLYMNRDRFRILASFQWDSRQRIEWRDRCPGAQKDFERCYDSLALLHARRMVLQLIGPSEIYWSRRGNKAMAVEAGKLSSHSLKT